MYNLNSIRQELTKESAERIIEQIQLREDNKEKVIVVYDKEIHESIAGIVAGRVKEKFNLPCIVLTKGKETPKGSARSIEQYNIFEELTKCSDLLGKFGGHPMAAGLSLEEDDIPKLREKLNDLCKLTDEDVMPVVKIDLPLPLNYLNQELIETIERLRPFGKSNPSPLFAVKDVTAERIWLLGKEKNIMKLRLKIPERGIYIDAITFDKYEEFKEEFIKEYGERNLLNAIDSSYINVSLDMIYYPTINEFRGQSSVQLNIKNIRINRK